MKRLFIGYMIAILLVFVVEFLFFQSLRSETAQVDVTAVNDVAKYAEEQWGNQSVILERAKKYDFGCALFDMDKKLLQRTQGMPELLTEAINHRDIVLNISEDNQIKGYLVLSDQANQIIENFRDNLLQSCFWVILCVIFLTVVFLVLLYWQVSRPFGKLRKFAEQVARGDLDIPLSMDRGNMFGAFTESFDIMREELSIARQKQYEAEKSKKELIASLSHDIKTPVASIRSASEVLLVTAQDDKQKEKLIGIEHKTEQIELLIDNLFHATLEELEELEVEPLEHSSLTIQKMIYASDYSSLVEPFEMPECLIYFDELRLGQVIDNIVSNSYKYANTAIHVNCELWGDCLVIQIRDHGTTLSQEELRRCTEKFYRGSNGQGHTGSGLGLYISSFFMHRMGGELKVEGDDGFCVNLYLPIA